MECQVPINKLSLNKIKQSCTEFPQITRINIDFSLPLSLPSFTLDQLSLPIMPFLPGYLANTLISLGFSIIVAIFENTP